MDEFLELHAVAKGKVQGVFFRATTKKHADSLGITGTVCNLPDGTVEIFAQGSKERLEKFVHLLKTEAHPAQISHLDFSYSPISQTKISFEIVRF